LKIVANYAVGFDNIDLVAARRRGIIVTNTPGGASRAVAEHAWALIIACAKRILEADAYVRRGKYKEWTATTLLGRGIHGKTLGIVGLGRIGEAVVEIGHRGFGTKILYTDPHPNRAFERRYDAARVPLNVLLKEADIVSLHVPLLPTTRHLIGARELARMKTTAILINTARGPVIDERALVAALKRRKIAAAGLDVFEHEPKLAPGLVKLSNAVLSPHTASSTWDARCFMGDLAARNILAALRGKPVLSRVA
jgi:lactate dehydrogenase-like 2-hydroxyacid dehydrogenase